MVLGSASLVARSFGCFGLRVIAMRVAVCRFVWCACVAVSYIDICRLYPHLLWLGSLWVLSMFLVDPVHWCVAYTHSYVLATPVMLGFCSGDTRVGPCGAGIDVQNVLVQRSSLAVFFHGTRVLVLRFLCGSLFIFLAWHGSGSHWGLG